MDIWHRVGRIVRFSNLGTLLFFTLNILLIVAVFVSSGSIVELICIYFFTVAIKLIPIRRNVPGCLRRSKRYKKSRYKTSSCSDKPVQVR